MGIFLAIMSLLALIFLVIRQATRYSGEDAITLCVLGTLIWGFSCLAIFLPTQMMTGGFMPEYSSGHRDGYITKLSRKGVIWKTYEGQMQVGTGNQASLQGLYDYSVVDPELVEELDKHAADGTRVRLYYNQYLIKNLREGESAAIVYRVEIL